MPDRNLLTLPKRVNPELDSIFYGVVDPSGTPVDRKFSYLSMVANTSRPLFIYGTGSSLTVTSTDTWYTIPFTSQLIDYGSDVSSGVFTAPVDGIYLFIVMVRVDDLQNDSSYTVVRINNSGTQTCGCIFQTNRWNTDPNYWSFKNILLTELTADDTVLVQIYQYSGTANVQNVIASDIYNQFAGYLVM